MGGLMYQSRVKALLNAQGLYYFITGIWPILHISSFLKVTGYKTDLWLVQTLGALLSVNGVAFILSASRSPAFNAARFIAIGDAAVLAFVDIYFNRMKIIGSIYLADAVIELALLFLWFFWSRPGGKEKFKF